MMQGFLTIDIALCWTLVDNYDRFWGMNYKLMQNDGVMARNLPIRIYLPENCPVIQEPVSPIDDKGKPHIPRKAEQINSLTAQLS